jgi:hypothetical protein
VSGKQPDEREQVITLRGSPVRIGKIVLMARNPTTLS